MLLLYVHARRHLDIVGLAGQHCKCSAFAKCIALNPRTPKRTCQKNSVLSHPRIMWEGGSFWKGSYAETFWPALSRALDYLTGEEWQMCQAREGPMRPEKFAILHTPVLCRKGRPPERCPTDFKNSGHFLDDIACFCPRTRCILKSAELRSAFVPHGIAARMCRQDAKLVLQMRVRRQILLQVLLACTSFRHSFPRCECLPNGAMFLTLNLSQSNRLMVCARGAEYDALDLLVDHACASSVRASPLIAPHQQVFGEACPSTNLRLEQWGHSKATAFRISRLRGSNLVPTSNQCLHCSRPEMTPLSVQGTTFSCNSRTISPQLSIGVGARKKGECFS